MIMQEEKKGIATISASQLHHVDHLAVISILMDIPILFIDEQDFQLGKKYYPGLKAEKKEEGAMTPEYLISNYDVWFTSDIMKRESFDFVFRKLEEKYRKKLRRVFCPHGFSDKGYYFKFCAQEDICLIYGQNMLDMFKEFGILDTLRGYVFSGNYRYTYFKGHEEYFANIMEEEIFSHFDKKRPVILYAPTWQDFEQSTTFFDYYHYILDHLPLEFNMIVKLHPMLEMDDPAAYYSIIGKYEKKPNILFIREFPLVYPLLSRSDIYLGDMSSVGYDFLTFNKPMFFLTKPKSEEMRTPYLFRCGIEITPDHFSKLYQIIEKNIPNDRQNFSDIRSQVYDYTFGPERSFQDIKADIIKAYS